nr:unnamed protein product [Callosobruchus chinensis]
MLQQLAAGMVQLTTTVNILAQSIDNKEGKSHAASQAAAKEGHVAILSDKSYITSWKELGGTNIAFTPGGKMHPMAFLRLIEKIFQETGVPEQRKIGLAITCLRGSATDWASIKEKSFTSYGIFREMFINRFWGVDKQRDLFLHLNYGKFESGSRAEYFLNLVNQASFLSESIPEEKLIKMLAKHFSPDIQRGMMILGLNEFDAVDDYLHNLDESYTEEEHVPRDNRRNLRRRDREVDRAVGRPNPNPNAYRETRNDTPNWRGEDAVRNHDNNLRNITKFNEDNDLMSESSDIEEGQECEKFETPAILLEVGGEPLPALLDSGSEVTAISEKLYNKLVGTLKFPVLPVTKVSISVATGNVKQRIKKQVLLPIVLSDIGKQIDIRCLVVSGLNCDILLGCDFLQKHNVVVDFKRSAASITIKEDKHLINFVSCNEVDTHINICKTVALVIKPKVDEKHRYLDSDFSTKAEEAQADTEVKDQLRNLLEEHNDIFSECPGMAKSYVHRIEMDDVTPFNVPKYPVPLVYRDQVHDQIREMLEWGIIAREKSAYISPLVVVKKRVATQLGSDYDNLKSNFTNMRQDQLNDGWIRDKIEFLEALPREVPILSKRGLRTCEWFVLHEGLLFKKGDDLNPGYKLCTPQKQVKALVLAHHNDSGHYGKAKVLQHMKSTFYWPRMQHDIRRIVACCDLCQKVKPSNMSKGLLHSVLPTCPGELVCSDLIGPLPPSRGAATYALVFVDAFSKHTKIYALKRATSKAILAKLVSDYIPNIQRPKAILSDNGTQFASVEWKAVLARENIAVKHISVYFPEGNMTERYTREIGRLLRTYCHDKHTRWAYVLGFVEQCINNAVNESTGSTPNFLQFGIQRKTPITQVISFSEDNQQPPSREMVLVLARERLLAKAEQRAAKFNAKINPVSFKEGDKVLIRVHAQSSAEDRLIRMLFLLYEGPYIVQRQAGPNSYVLVDDQGRELPKQNVINLKEYK